MNLLSSALVLGAMMTLAGCKTAAPKPSRFEGQTQPPAPAGYQPASATLIDLNGENCCAQAIPGESQFLFLSRRRPRHDHFQVYVFDRVKQKERRLTFHDGGDQGPTYDPATGHLYYASTTDFLKENPKFLLEALGRPLPAPPAIGPRPLWTSEGLDLYRAARDGTHITRLTKAPGFEGEVALNPRRPEIVFSAIEKGQSVIFRANLDGSGQAVLISSTGHDSEARFSPDGKDLVWVRYSMDGTTSQLWLARADGRKAKALTELKGIQQSPLWRPDGSEIVFSSNSEDPTNFELYVIKKDGSCLRRLTYSLGFDGLPGQGSEPDKIFFTSDRQGNFQVYEMTFAPPTCP